MSPTYQISQITLTVLCRYDTSMYLQEDNPAKFTPTFSKSNPLPEDFVNGLAGYWAPHDYPETAVSEEWREAKKVLRRTKKGESYTFRLYDDGLPRLPDDTTGWLAPRLQYVYKEWVRIHLSKSSASALCPETYTLSRLEQRDGKMAVLRRMAADS